MTHHVTIHLRYVGTTPWKWEGRCTCGWVCQSWSWSRPLQAERRGINLWLEENGSAEGGALPMTLDHVGLGAAA